jgi:hypothetical protein
MIQFTAENRPTCNPQDENQCKLNNAALQDVWDALACLASQEVITEAKCYDFKDVVGEDTFFIPKADIPTIPEHCIIDFKWNGVEYYVEDIFNPLTEILFYTISSNATDWIITTNMKVGSVEEPCDVRIKVFKKETFSDMFNKCIVNPNCRD